MNKGKLTETVEACKAETKEVIETFLDVLNSGQRKKILKQENIKAICNRFGVETEE